MTNPQHSETVKRWDYSLYQRSMMIDADGDYVLYTDYAALVNGRDALVEALKAVNAISQFCVCPYCRGAKRHEVFEQRLVGGGLMSSEESRYETFGTGKFNDCWHCKGRGQAEDVYAAFETAREALKKAGAM